MSRIFTHDFSGEADATPIGTDTSGPDFFDNVAPGAGELTYRTKVPNPRGSAVGRAGVAGTGATPNMRWVPGGTIPRIASLFFFSPETLPDGNTILFRTSETDGSGGLSFRITDGGRIDLLNESFSLVGSFAHLLAAGEWVRIEFLLDTGTGVAETALYHGLNLFGKVPNETLKAVDSFGDAILDARWGIQTSRTNLNFHYDYLALDGEQIPSPPQVPSAGTVAFAGHAKIEPGGTTVDDALGVSKSRTFVKGQ
jgi:hypothetical protein